VEDAGGAVGGWRKCRRGWRTNGSRARARHGWRMNWAQNKDDVGNLERMWTMIFRGRASTVTPCDNDVTCGWSPGQSLRPFLLCGSEPRFDCMEEGWYQKSLSLAAAMLWSRTGCDYLELRNGICF